MSGRVVINGKEVRNPFARVLVGTLGLVFAGLVVAGVLFFVLPIVGVIVTFSVGLVGVLLVCLGVALPILILGGMLFGVVAMPFSLFDRKKKDSKHKRNVKCVAMDGGVIHVTGDNGEEVDISADGIHVKGGDSEVKVSWQGVCVRDGAANRDDGK